MIRTERVNGTEVGTVSEQPAWQDVADRLRGQIKDGTYKPGDTLPSEVELKSQFGFSRDTVRRALNRLTQEGLLTPGRGRLGRQVRASRALAYYPVRSESMQRADERATSNRDAWVADAEDQGRVPGQLIKVTIIEAEPEISSRLGISDGELVVVRQRVRTIDGEPHNRNDTHYPRDIAEAIPEIMSPADVKQGIIALMRDHGYVQERYSDTLETRMPTPDEADELAIPPGVPVLVQYRTGYSTDRPLKVTVTVWPGDRTSLVYEFSS